MGWLEQLAAAGEDGAVRPRSRVGFDCFTLGWTRRAGPGSGRERLTAHGEAQLFTWRSSGTDYLTAGVLARCVIVLAEQRAVVFRSGCDVRTGLVSDPDMRAWLEDFDRTIEAARMRCIAIERAILAREAAA
jgi:hypothetical protein